MAEGDPIRMKALDRLPLTLWYLSAEKYMGTLLDHVKRQAAARNK